MNVATMALLAVPTDQTDIKKNSDPKVVNNTSFYLAQNWPNPFSHETVISYSLPIVNKKGLSAENDYPVTLKIYNLSNRLVRTLVNKKQGPGSYSVSWDGRDRNGNRVSAGVYLYKIEGLGYTVSKKAVLIQ